MGENLTTYGAVYQVRERIQNDKNPPGWKGNFLREQTQTGELDEALSVIPDNWHEFEVSLVAKRTGSMIDHLDSMSAYLTRIPGFNAIVTKMEFPPGEDYLHREHAEVILDELHDDVDEDDMNAQKYFPYADMEDFL